MAIYDHYIVVYESSGNDPSDTSTISQSFSSAVLVAYNSNVSVSDAVTVTWNILNQFKPGTNYTVHYVVLDDSSATASNSATFTAATDSEIQGPAANRRRSTLVRM